MNSRTCLNCQSKLEYEIGIMNTNIAFPVLTHEKLYDNDDRLLMVCSNSSCPLYCIPQIEPQQRVKKTQLKSHDFPKIYEELNINLDKMGCIMIDVEPLKSMYSIEVDGAGVALYYAKNKERKWINGWVVGDVAHITLLYGLLENGHVWKKHVDTVLTGWELREVEIDHISYFDSPYEDEEYYCIVAHIKVTDELMEGHQRLEFLPHINTFTGYKPHMTLCYLDKKQGEAYRDRIIEEFNKLWSGKKLRVKELNYGYKKDE